MKKKKLVLPRFKDEKSEQKFWNKIDLSDYYTSDDFEKVSFPNLKPTTQSISIRLPLFMLYTLKEKANELGVPYQGLIKLYLKEGLKKKE